MKPRSTVLESYVQMGGKIVVIIGFPQKFEHSYKRMSCSMEESP
jgi:hypothetical protein